MQIHVHIDLAPGDEYTMTSNEAAEAVLKALGADESKDHCDVTAVASGSAGTAPAVPVV
jgi:hypothetical protein